MIVHVMENFNSFVGHPIYHNTCHMWASIVVHKVEVFTNSLSKWKNNWLENVV